MFIDKVKGNIAEAIELRKKIEVEKLEKHKQDLLKIDNIPTIIYKITEIYGNSMEQKELIVPILQDSFKSQMLINSEVIKKANYIVFQNGEFYVQFPTSYSRYIELGRIERPREPQKPKFNQKYENFLNLWKKYQNAEDKSIKKYLIDTYLQDVKNETPSYFNRKNVTMEKLENYASHCICEMDEYKKELDEWESKVEIFDNIDKVDAQFIKDIEVDLKTYKENAWRIEFKNLNENVLRILSF